MPKKAGLDPKEQLMAAAMIVGFGLFFQVNKQLSAHMQDCAARSAAIARIGYGILVIVAAGLILSGINAYHGNGDTTQRITTVEEKHHTP